MKIILRITYILMLCIFMTACAVGVPSENRGEGIDPNSNPVIVVDDETIVRKERYDADGNYVGYYRITSGTNCDVYGIVLLEYLDIDENVIKSFSPKYAGCVLDYYIPDEYTEWNEITSICEMSLVSNTSIEYIITPFSCGEIQRATYTMDGVTNQVEVYGLDGELSACIKTTKEGYSLDLWNWADDCLMVCEYYTDETYHAYIEKEVFFDSNRNLLCEVLIEPQKLEGSHNVIFSKLEVKSRDGKSLMIYEKSLPGSQFNIGGIGDGTQLIITEDCEDGNRILYEIYDLIEEKVFFKEKSIYDSNGNYSNKELEIFGGKVITTESKYAGYYKKAEFYDEQGNLRKTVDTTEIEKYFIIKWDKNNCDCIIEFYTEAGPTGEIDFYEPY